MSRPDTGRRKTWWMALLVLAVVAASCQGGGSAKTPVEAERPPQVMGDESQDARLDRAAKAVASDAISIVAAAPEMATDGDSMVALLEEVALTTQDENGRVVSVRAERSIGGCGQMPYCVYVQPASDEVPILGVAAWSPLGCVMAASDPDYGVWWGQASLGTGHPCTGGAAVSDYRRQRNVRGVRDEGTGASWQLGLPDGRPAPENGAAVKPSSDDCYTDNSEAGVPRDVNRYVVALLRGTANAGEIDEYDHCKYLPAIASMEESRASAAR